MEIRVQLRLQDRGALARMELNVLASRNSQQSYPYFPPDLQAVMLGAAFQEILLQPRHLEGLALSILGSESGLRHQSAPMIS